MVLIWMLPNLVYFAESYRTSISRFGITDNELSCNYWNILVGEIFKRNEFWGMYIEGRYWDSYIGGTDDCLALVDYLAVKQKEELSLGEIFSDLGLDKLHWNFRKTDVELGFTDSDGMNCEMHYAIDIVTALAALLLECKASGSINLDELYEEHTETSVTSVHITATPEEHRLMEKVLADFVSDPLAYDLSEMCPEEDMQEMAEFCEELVEELYG